MKTITPIDLNCDQNAPTADNMIAHFQEHFKLVVANTNSL